MDPPKERSRSTQVLGFHRVLPLLHPRVLTDRPTPPRPDQASDTVALGQQGAGSVRSAPRQNGQQTGLTTTRLQQNLLPPNRRVQVWGRSGPVARWRSKRSNAAQAPPGCILLGHLHPHRAKLRRPRLRIPRGLQINRTLEALLDLDEGAVCYQNGPQKPHILESPEEADRTDGAVAREITGLQFQNSPRRGKE